MARIAVQAAIEHLRAQFEQYASLSDVGNGIACRNSCEDRVLALNALQRKGENALKRSSKSFYSLAAFLFSMGIIFFVNLRTDDLGMRTFDILFTTVFWATAVFFLALARKAQTDSR